MSNGSQQSQQILDRAVDLTDEFISVQKDPNTRSLVGDEIYEKQDHIGLKFAKADAGQILEERKKKQKKQIGNLLPQSALGDVDLWLARS